MTGADRQSSQPSVHVLYLLLRSDRKKINVLANGRVHQSPLLQHKISNWLEADSLISPIPLRQATR